MEEQPFTTSQLAQVPMPVRLLAEGDLRRPLLLEGNMVRYTSRHIAGPLPWQRGWVPAVIWAPWAARGGASPEPAPKRGQAWVMGDDQPRFRGCWVCCSQMCLWEPVKDVQPHSSFLVSRKVLMGSLHLIPPTRFASFSLTHCV